MNFLSRLFNPGRQLSLKGHRDYRQRVRSRVDEMRKELGLEPVKWGRL